MTTSSPFFNIKAYVVVCDNFQITGFIAFIAMLHLNISHEFPFHTKIMMLIITYLSVLYCNGFSLEYLGFEAKKGLKDDKIFLHVTEI